MSYYCLHEARKQHMQKSCVKGTDFTQGTGVLTFSLSWSRGWYGDMEWVIYNPYAF